VQLVLRLGVDSDSGVRISFFVGVFRVKVNFSKAERFASQASDDLIVLFQIDPDVVVALTMRVFEKYDVIPQARPTFPYTEPRQLLAWAVGVLDRRSSCASERPSDTPQR
jgi:hypothetical protein